MILSIPAIFKVLLVFVLILVLNKARLSLSLSLIAGSLALGFWMNLSPSRVVTGIAIGFVGASFPLIILLFP